MFNKRSNPPPHKHTHTQSKCLGCPTPLKPSPYVGQIRGGVNTVGRARHIRLAYASPPRAHPTRTQTLAHSRLLRSLSHSTPIHYPPCLFPSLRHHGWLWQQGGPRRLGRVVGRGIEQRQDDQEFALHRSAPVPSPVTPSPPDRHWVLIPAGSTPREVVGRTQGGRGRFYCFGSGSCRSMPAESKDDLL